MGTLRYLTLRVPHGTELLWRRTVTLVTRKQTKGYTSQHAYVVQIQAGSMVFGPVGTAARVSLGHALSRGHSS
jgi:hypothetical protein